MISWSEVLAPLYRYLAYAVAAMVAWGLLKLLFYRWKQKRLLRIGIKNLDTLSGRDFEHLLVPVFKAKGYKVELTPSTGDWGADLLLTKKDERTVVQAKRWKSKVGVKALGDVLRARDKYQATDMLYVSTSEYTDRAKEQAEASGIVLWDRDDFIRELELARKRR